MRGKLFRRGNFLLTAVGLRAKGFYTPYDYFEKDASVVEPYPLVAELFDRHRTEFQEFLNDVHGNEVRFQAFSSGKPRPDWNSRFISRLDGAVIYTAVSRFRPGRVIEIGSGNSTHFLCRAVIDHALDTQIICIDPAPRIDITGLPIRFERRKLSTVDVEEVGALESGDVLFVDSSHILQEGFDVDIVLNRMLPVLRSGVLVHFHDIFLPFPYPPSWSEFRFNEQNALIGWLLSGRFRPIFASHFVWREMKAELAAVCPGFPLDTVDNGGSLWLQAL